MTPPEQSLKKLIAEQFEGLDVVYTLHLAGALSILQSSRVSPTDSRFTDDLEVPLQIGPHAGRVRFPMQALRLPPAELLSVLESCVRQCRDDYDKHLKSLESTHASDY